MIQYDGNKQEFTGSEIIQFQNLETGEIEDVQRIFKKPHGQKAFWKVYLMDFLSILGIIESKQLDVLIYILEHTKPSDNLFIGTQVKISEKTKVSHQTVSTIMKKLQRHGLIRKVQNGVWFISPQIMLKGDERKKNILISYEKQLINEEIEKYCEKTEKEE